MTEKDWQQIEEIFHAVRELPAEDRSAFLDEKCLDNPELRREIESLLAEAEQTDGFLSNPMMSLGLNILAHDQQEKVSSIKQIASYKILKLIGRGGTGYVFLAEDTRLERLVALKVLPSSFTQKNEAVMRFQQEAKTASTVAHQNVAHIYEFGEFEGRYYLAMEYVPGRTLRELIREKLINQKFAIEIALQIAAALSAAHKLAIVHRDIKPENVIVTEDGIVKVLDFGIAKQTLLSPPSENQTKPVTTNETIPGLIIGTTSYMSPEQVRGQSVRANTDIWSLGIVLYEMLAGARPFTGETPSDIQAAILRDQVPSLPVNLKCYQELTTIFDKSLQTDILNRYQTISDFSQDLEKVRAALNLNSNRKNPATTGGIGKRKWQIFFLVFGILLILASGIFLFGLIQAHYFQRNPFATSFLQSSKRIESLAIIPFSIRGHADNAEILNYFSLDLTGELTRGIGAANLFPLKSSFMAYNARDLKNITYLRDRLKVSTILHGTIINNGDNVEVQVELIDTSDGSVFWQDSINEKRNHLYKLRTDLIRLICRNTQTFCNSDKQLVQQFHLLSPYTGDGRWEEGENWYQSYLSNTYVFTINSRDNAVKALQESLKFSWEAESTYCALANKYEMTALALHSHNDLIIPSLLTYDPADQNMENALSNIIPALYTNPDSAQAHYQAGLIKMEYKSDFTGAERDFRQAIDLNPNNAVAHFMYGTFFLTARGKFDEALKELEIANELDRNSPSVPSSAAMAWIKLLMKDYSGAIADCDRSIELKTTPGIISVYMYKSIAMAKLGQFEQAEEVAKQAIEKALYDEMATFNLGIVYGMSGQTDKAKQIANDLEEKIKSGNRNISDYDLAVIYAAIGEKDHALQLLENESKTKSARLLTIESDPLLDPLRNEPRFKEIISQVKSSYLTAN